MNPVNNNSSTNPGAGTSGGFGTTPVGGVGGPSGFSTGNVLDNATKDATSQASAKTGEVNSTASGMQSDSPSSMTMDAPETPFVPAAPAPGSIGSAASGPAATDSTNLAAAVAPTGADGSAAFAPVNDANPTMPPVGGNSNLVAQAANETPATSAAFNPFAPSAANNTPAGGAAASTTSPAAAAAPNGGAATNQAVMPSPFQAKMESLAAKSPKASGGSNVLTVIFAVVGAIAIIAAIIFCVLWRQAVNVKQEIRYIETSAINGGAGADSGVLTCSRMYGAGDVAGMENLINEEASLTLNFTGDEWQSSGLYAVYNFTDSNAATVANDSIFAAMVASASLSSGSGETIVSASSQPLDSRVEYREDTDIALMAGNSNMADGRDIPRTDDGSIQRNRADVQAYYEGQGWACK